MKHIIVAVTPDMGVFAFGTKAKGDPFATRAAAYKAAKKIEDKLGYKINGTTVLDIVPFGNVAG